jgi:hypothetical protein
MYKLNMLSLFEVYNSTLETERWMIVGQTDYDLFLGYSLRH